MSMKRQQAIKFSFGIIADVQYANAPDGYNFAKTNKRYYRGALEKLKTAITSWQDDNIKKPSFVLQMGDALDGVNKRLGLSQSSLNTVLDTFNLLTVPIYHVWGNHEYYNFSPKQLLDTALYSGNLKDSSPVQGKVYYSAQPHPRLKVLAMDTYEISMLASEKDSEEYRKAEKYLEVNKNEDKNSGLGLEGSDKRFKQFNGGVTDAQLQWMEDQLRQAKERQQNVIIIGHCPIYVPSSTYECLCFNAAEVMEVVHKYDQCIVASFSGHDHAGGHAFDERGIHHMTLPGVLENDEESDFGTVYVYADRMEICGNGRVPSVTVPLRYCIDQDVGESTVARDEVVARSDAITCNNGS